MILSTSTFVDTCLSERTCLREGEYPLVARVLYGPCEKISKLFITETDLGEEVTYDVSLSSLSLLSFSGQDKWPLFHVCNIDLET